MKIEEAEELIEKLQNLSENFKNDVPEKYIDWIDEIWCELKDEVELEKGNSEEVEEFGEYPEPTSDEWAWQKHQLWEVR